MVAMGLSDSVPPHTSSIDPSTAAQAEYNPAFLITEHTK